MNKTISCLACASLTLGTLMAQDSTDLSAGFYTVNPLVSDVSGGAPHQDANLINAWGLAFVGTGPWWVNAEATGLSLLYNGSGVPQSLIVTVPPASGTGKGTPTGIVGNATQDFQIAPGKPGVFLFATLDGTISGWNPNVNNTLAIVKVTASAVYTGLTMAQLNGANVLYAANALGSIDVYDTNFNKMTLSPGAFTDPGVPTGYAPYNVQALGGNIFVTWSNGGGGAGAGYVSEFTPAGTLVMELQHGTWMNAPWGLALAPLNGFGTGFGPKSGRILVGQLGSGQIAAFNTKSGKFEGLLNDTNGNPITIDGLWGIGFGNNGGAGSAKALYFASGPSFYGHGLFGSITFTSTK
jgi:uncharacterized protein (TIGR03118 family)